MKGSLQLLRHAKCRIPATVSYPAISVYPGVYQSAMSIRPNQHSCGSVDRRIKRMTAPPCYQKLVGPLFVTSPGPSARYWLSDAVRMSLS